MDEKQPIFYAPDGIPYTVQRRKIKYPRLEFRTGILELILPLHLDERIVLEKKRDWIKKKYSLIQKALMTSENLEIIKRDSGEFRKLIDVFINEGEKSLQVKAKDVKIRKMKTKWGSCSSRGVITINRLSRYLPEKHLKYLVFHELAHLIERKHNKYFWALLKRFFPDAEKIEEDLFAYWYKLNSMF